jgi:twitching motility protein PilT
VEFIDGLCCLAGRQGASDIFLHAGQTPQFRLHGELLAIGSATVSAEEMESLWSRCGAGRDELDYDGSYISSDGNRFRVNLFRTLFARGAVLRPIKMAVPGIETLGLPAQLLASWVVRPSGLILVTGPTGSGKSTTIASCLDWLNQNYHRHIVTIEDPIEYLFTPDKALFSQREVGSDTPTFAEGLRRSLRQSPDVILLGEIRDSLSAVTALQAAETGHLVMATLHSSNILDSLERISRLFDAGERESVFHLLGQQLIGIVCQKLVPAATEGRALVVEHFENQAVTRKWIGEQKFRELADFLARGDNPSNRTFLHALAAMAQDGRITEETALQTAANPRELQRMLRGIDSSSILA